MSTSIPVVRCSPYESIKVRAGTMTTQDATDKLCDLNTIKHFVRKWDDEMLLFQTHLKRYLLALRPETAIAFHETDRYTKPPKSARLPPGSPLRMSADRAAKFIDVAVFATRKLKKGDVIELRGGFAHLTEEEDDKLRNSGEKMDFSVFWSDRHDCFSLLLGPARFVNVSLFILVKSALVLRSDLTARLPEQCRIPVLWRFDEVQSHRRH